MQVAPPALPFRSCLLIAPPRVDTLRIARAMHSAGIAVLERSPGANATDLALTNEFDLVAWVCTTDDTCWEGVFGQIAAARGGLIALLEDASPAAVSACLRAGADACLHLDADEMLIAAQAHAVLRRRVPGFAASPASGVLQVGDLLVDVDRCEVERAGTFLPLTASEFRIIEYMARNAGRVLRPHEILNAVSEGYEYLPREAQEVFKVYVRRIRRKLEPNEQDPRYLVTVRGFGYRLEGGQITRQTGRGLTAIQTA